VHDDAVMVDAHGDDDTVGGDIRRRRQRQKWPRPLLRDKPQQSYSTQEVASQAGLSASKVRYKSQWMGLRVGRLGPYVRYAPSAGEHLRHEEGRKQLGKGLIYLRALVQSAHNEKEEEITTLCKPGGAAYKWVHRQQDAGKSPGQVFAILERDPAIPDITCREPQLFQHLRGLFEQFGWDVPWPKKHYQRTISSQGRTLSSRKSTTLPKAHSGEEGYEASTA
jgi:hypothetical protein